MTRTIIILVGAGLVITGFVCQNTTHNFYNYVGLAGFVLVTIGILKGELRHK